MSDAGDRPRAAPRRRWSCCGASTRPAPAPRSSRLTQLEGGWSRHTYVLNVADPDRRAPPGYIGRVRPDDSVLDTDLGQEFEIYRSSRTSRSPRRASTATSRATTRPSAAPTS